MMMVPFLYVLEEMFLDMILDTIHFFIYLVLPFSGVVALLSSVCIGSSRKGVPASFISSSPSSKKMSSAEIEGGGGDCCFFKDELVDVDFSSSRSCRLPSIEDAFFCCWFPNIDAVVDFLDAESGFFSDDASLVVGLVVAAVAVVWGCLVKVVVDDG